MKPLMLLFTLILAACGAGPREAVTIYGQIVFSDGAPPPPSYVLYLKEIRQPSVLSRNFTIAIVIPDSEGFFSINAYVCEHFSIAAPFGPEVGAQRGDGTFNSPIRIRLDATATANIRSRSWPDPWSMGETEADEFSRRAQELGGAQHVPC